MSVISAKVLLLNFFIFLITFRFLDMILFLFFVNIFRYTFNFIFVR